MQFKTNINCGGCIEQVKPYLDALKSIESWDVDTNNPDKILTIKGDVDPDTVREVVRKAGFKAKETKNGFFKKLFG